MRESIHVGDIWNKDIGISRRRGRKCDIIAQRGRNQGRDVFLICFTSNVPGSSSSNLPPHTLPEIEPLLDRDACPVTPEGDPRNGLGAARQVFLLCLQSTLISE